MSKPKRAKAEAKERRIPQGFPPRKRYKRQPGKNKAPWSVFNVIDVTGDEPPGPPVKHCSPEAPNISTVSIL